MKDVLALMGSSQNLITLIENDSEDYGALTGADWCDLILIRPDMVKHCRWDLFNGVDWAFSPKYLHLCEPDNLDYYDIRFLRKFCPHHRIERSLPEPDYIDHSGEEWVDLLIADREQIKYCEWDRLSGADWALLLKYHFRLDLICPWESFTKHDWQVLIAHSPRYSLHRDYWCATS